MLHANMKLQGKVFGLFVDRKGLEDLKVEVLVDAITYVLAELSAATDLKTLELTLLNKLVGIKIDSVFLKEMELALVYNGEVIPIMHVTADLISPQKHIKVTLTLKPLPVIAFDVFATAAADFIETQATLKVANLEFIDLKQKTQVTLVEMVPVKFINQFHYGLYLGDIVTGEVIANVDLTNPTKTFTLIIEPTAFHKIEMIWSLNIDALSPIFVLNIDALS